MLPLENTIPTLDFFDFSLVNAPNPSPFAVRGDNQKNIGVICTSLLEADRVFLEKMLAAIQCQWLGDIALVEVEKDYTTCSFATISHSVVCKKWLIFGFKAQEIGWQFNVPLYQGITWLQTQFIFAESLTIIQQDANKKKQLWGAMQQVFLK